MIEYRGESRGRKRWRRRRRTLAGAGIGLISLLAAYVVVTDFSDIRCGSPFDGIRLEEGECVGVTDGSFVFDPGLAEIQAKIKAENDEAADRAKEVGFSLVKIGLLMPITATETSALDLNTVRSALEGAYVALCRANECYRELVEDPSEPGEDVSLRGQEPQIQLYLANEGSVQQGSEYAVSQLVDMTDDDVPLVAVMGPAIGTAETQSAAKRLSEEEIPVITGAATPDGLAAGIDGNSDDKGIANVLRAAPSNTDFVKAMGRYLTEHDELESGVLLYDDASQDTFVTTLKEAYESELEGKYFQQSSSLPFPGRTRGPVPPEIFRSRVLQICGGERDMVFFAGRAPDARDFLEELGDRPCEERDGEITVLFVELGLFPDADTLETLDEGNITLLHATGYNPNWSCAPRADHTPDGFGAFYAVYQEVVNNDDPSALDNGYAATYHDSLAIAVIATRLNWPEGGPMLSAADVTHSLWQLHGDNAVVGATGTLSFIKERNGGSPIDKHVPILPVRDLSYGDRSCEVTEPYKTVPREPSEDGAA